MSPYSCDLHVSCRNSGISTCITQVCGHSKGICILAQVLLQSIQIHIPPYTAWPASSSPTLFAYLSKCVCAPSTADHTPQTQVNKVRSHPTLPTIVTAHEDKFIRFFDSSSGQMQHEMIAHMDAVTGIAIDPNGLYVVSASECLVCMCVVVLAHPSVLTFTYRLQSRTVTLASYLHLSTPIPYSHLSPSLPPP